MSPDQMEITYSLTYREMLEILKIIDGSPCRELRLELEGFKLEIIKGNEPPPSADILPIAAPGPASPGPALFPGPGKPQEKIPEKAVKDEIAGAAAPERSAPQDTSAVSGIEVKSPLTGTFYRAPAPGARPFVEIGSEVERGEQLAIVEVMKLMNSIKAPVKGTVRKILAENDTQVKMGQTLMIVDPA